MFQNYGQTPEGSASQPGAPGAVAQQRPAQMPGQAVQGTGSQNTAASQHLLLQQALQQNPELAAQLTQRLQPGNGQASPLLSAASSLKPLFVPGLPCDLTECHAVFQLPGMVPQQSGAPSLQQQQQQLIMRQQQAAAAAAGAASGSLQSRPPAKQSVPLTRPTAVFSASGVRPPSPAPVAGQIASKPPASAADVLPAAKRKKRKLMDNRLPEKVTCAIFTVF